MLFKNSCRYNIEFHGMKTWSKTQRLFYKNNYVNTTMLQLNYTHLPYC